MKLPPSEVTEPGLPNTLKMVTDDSQLGLFKDVISGDRINHAAWMRARATQSFVGTCRRCGSPLIPRAPYDIQRGEVMCTDYEAECSLAIDSRVVPVDSGGKRREVTGCGATVCAPNGHLAKRKHRRLSLPRPSDDE